MRLLKRDPVSGIKGKIEKTIKEKAFKHARIFSSTEFAGTAIIQAIGSYIPMTDFQEIFNYVSQLSYEKQTTKVIFDKRSLSVFHQPSMDGIL